MPAKRKSINNNQGIIAAVKAIALKPIGFVKNTVKKPRFGKFAEEVSEIILNEKFSEGLDGVEDYSHIIVVYWMDKIKGYVTKHRPQGNPEVPIVGIFACRCPQRPNPIGITTVKIVKRKKNKIIVQGLDVLDKTPVLDIKPYWPQYDKVSNGKIPKWVYKLEF